MAVLARLAPWSALADVQKEMDQLVRTVFGANGSEGDARLAHKPARAWAPAIDVLSRGDQLVVRAELPGVDPDKDVDISVVDGVLRIRGERHLEKRQEDTNYFRLETSYGSFERSIPLPEGIKLDEITALQKHGLLEIVIPVAAPKTQAVKKIQIQADSGEEASPTIEAASAQESPPAG